MEIEFVHVIHPSGAIVTTKEHKEVVVCHGDVPCKAKEEKSINTRYEEDDRTRKGMHE